MMLFSHYKGIKENRLKGRYISMEMIAPILSEMKSKGWLHLLGYSEEKCPIYSIKLGHGPKKVLGWSQMHGNESTTTKALFDFLSVLGNEKWAGNFLDSYTFQFIPILNPDGALRYTRENANGIDLNRDAQNLSQSESRVLRSLFDEYEPDLCLNLHDQRTIYGVSSKEPATLSFLAPAADAMRTITPAREQAMMDIVTIYSALQSVIPGKIGRYDDSYNSNCVGDTFQSKGVPTILFEAGHFPGDYQRENTREYIFYALWELFSQNEEQNKTATTLESYFEIPENQKNFRDVLLRNVSLNGRIIDLAIQFKEELVEGALQFQPTIDAFGELKDLVGHKELAFDGEEILINSHENVFVDEKIVTITYKSLKKPIIF